MILLKHTDNIIIVEISLISPLNNTILILLPLPTSPAVI